MADINRQYQYVSLVFFSYKYTWCMRLVVKMANSGGSVLLEFFFSHKNF